MFLIVVRLRWHCWFIGIAPRFLVRLRWYCWFIGVAPRFLVRLRWYCWFIGVATLIRDRWHNRNDFVDILVTNDASG
ncbi:hypothetical protein C4784_30160, partial [Salmonella enterica subsp. enterica serovar Gaminara]